jgi:hypothetical protein
MKSRHREKKGEGSFQNQKEDANALRWKRI